MTERVDLDAAQKRLNAHPHLWPVSQKEAAALVTELRVVRLGLEQLYAYLMDEDATDPPEVALPKVAQMVYALAYTQPPTHDRSREGG
jgi:hypothetical protein